MKAGFLNHLLLISLFELKRLFNSRQGLLYLVTFAVVWFFILMYPVRYAAELIAPTHGGEHAGAFFAFLGFGSLLHWQIPELGVYWHFALLIFPLLAVVSSAAQTCSDRQRGTLRFLLLRSSRDSIFFGRFFGMMLIHAFLLMLTLLSAIMLVMFREINLLLPALNNALVILLNMVLVLMPFTAMMAALSATVKTARQAIVWAILIWSFLAGIIGGLSRYLPAIDGLKVLVPGYQMSALSQLHEWQTLQLAYIPVLQTLVLLALGRWIMAGQKL